MSIALLILAGNGGKLSASISEIFSDVRYVSVAIFRLREDLTYRIRQLTLAGYCLDLSIILRFHSSAAA
jgi:hypothetical protein